MGLQNHQASKPYSIRTSRALLLPDIHQVIEWARRVIEREQGNFDHLICLGDYFDSFKSPPLVSTPRETAEFLMEIMDEFEDRVTFLLGNHDIPYMEFWKQAVPGRTHPQLVNECPGYQEWAAPEIAAILGARFFPQCRLFVECNGYLISHAGVHPRFWLGDFPGIDDPYESLEEACKVAFEHLGGGRMALLGCGGSRGGWEEVGGITWLDWKYEFEDWTHMPPQIVGHSPPRVDEDTHKLEPQARRKGRSWCVDGNQTCWALLDADGTLQPRYFKDLP